MKFNRGRHAIWASRDDVNNSAPHKPVLMLAVVKMYNLGVYNSNNHNGVHIINDDLVEHFKQLGNIIKAPNLDIHLPFFHLKTKKMGIGIISTIFRVRKHLRRSPQIQE